MLMMKKSGRKLYVEDVGTDGILRPTRDLKGSLWILSVCLGKKPLARFY
jgi:hypothetical protein